MAGALDTNGKGQEERAASKVLKVCSDMRLSICKVSFGCFMKSK